MLQQVVNLNGFKKNKLKTIVVTGAAGGSGIVILSVPDADYTGTTTGSPTVATGVSGKTVMSFTGSGSYTA